VHVRVGLEFFKVVKMRILIFWHMMLGQRVIGFSYFKAMYDLSDLEV